ncbi:hypothetical protein AAFF_G00103980 [Aldrovandia affinis]|uniref:Uncharacterized protein n=1 Tax=Aldrovandia affinis TaxID=143900 RepID=A0AAD7WBD9_9TELE|nr:hypothetical protein AAFF_G00103980 [Aldrovandia affinis]
METIIEADCVGLTRGTACVSRLRAAMKSGQRADCDSLSTDRIAASPTGIRCLSANHRAAEAALEPAD